MKTKVITTKRQKRVKGTQVILIGIGPGINDSNRDELLKATDTIYERRQSLLAYGRSGALLAIGCKFDSTDTYNEFVTAVCIMTELYEAVPWLEKAVTQAYLTKSPVIYNNRRILWSKQNLIEL